MNKVNDIQNELTNLAPALIPLQRLNVFTVPENYFNDFPVFLSETLNNESSFLPTVNVNMMDVPSGYFDSLAENILIKIKSLSQQTVPEELKVLSPALSAIGNDNIFTVPRRYFEDLPEIILSQVNKPAAVISMRSRSSFARYAAAAVITGIMGLSLFTLLNKKTIENEAPLTVSVVNEGKNNLQTNSFERLLETMSDAEIVGYLQNDGQDVNAALVASATDEKQVYSQI